MSRKYTQRSYTGPCAGCGIPMSDGYVTGSDYAPECRTCSDRRRNRIRRGELFTPTGYAGELIDNVSGRLVAGELEVA